MKKIKLPEKLKHALIVMAIIFLLVCVVDFLNNIALTSKRPTVIIGFAVVIIGIFWGWHCHYSLHESEKSRKKERESFFIFRFPKTLYGGPFRIGHCEQNHDLARLAEDYQIPESEEMFDHLVSCAVSDATSKYREKKSKPPHLPDVAITRQNR